MVDIWRLNTEMSLGVILFPPAPPKSGLAFFFTRVGLMPWRRSMALTTASPCPDISPLIRLPRRSVPSQANILDLTAASAMVLSSSC